MQVIAPNFRHGRLEGGGGTEKYLNLTSQVLLETKICSTSFEQSKPTCPCNEKKKEIGVSRRRPISLRRSRPTDSNQDSSESNIILLAYIRPRARSTLLPLLRYTVIICMSTEVDPNYIKCSMSNFS